ncbi:MAG: hypothetical protein WA110_09675 [Anaerolineaceae bacterium]
MTRQSSISRRDTECLCAYLDNALSSTEKAKFETRLAKSLSLQKALKEYTQLKISCKSLPVKKAPRNFTLTQEEARSLKPKPLLYPTFSHIAMVAVLLLALVFTSEFIFKNFSIPVAQVTESATLATVQPAEELAREDQKAPLIFTWGYNLGAGGKGGGAEGVPAGFGGGGGSVGITIADNKDLSGWGVGGGAETQQELPLENPLPEEESVPSVMATPEPQPTEEPTPLAASSENVEPLILGVREAEAGRVLSIYPDEEAQVDVQQDEVQAEPASEILSISIYVKYTLIGIAILFGLLAAAFYLKR